MEYKNETDNETEQTEDDNLTNKSSESQENDLYEIEEYKIIRLKYLLNGKNSLFFNYLDIVDENDLKADYLLKEGNIYRIYSNNNTYKFIRITDIFSDIIIYKIYYKNNEIYKMNKPLEYPTNKNDIDYIIKLTNKNCKLKLPNKFKNFNDNIYPYGKKDLLKENVLIYDMKPYETLRLFNKVFNHKPDEDFIFDCNLKIQL